MPSVVAKIDQLEKRTGQDLDGDGVVKGRQLMGAGTTKQLNTKAHSNLALAFEVFDRDGNGKLDPQEFMAIMTRTVGVTDALNVEEVKEFMSHFTDDEDGMLDYPAFCRAMVQLTGGDIDQDGHIDDQELERGLPEAGSAAIRAAASD